MSWTTKRGSNSRKIIVSCNWCGKSIVKYKSTVYKINFCGFDCYGKWCSVNRSKDNNPNWRGGNISYRGADWRIIKLKVLERANFKCEKCGVSNVSLQVHHIVPFRTFKEYRTANYMSNLIAVCISCHKKMEAQINIGKFGVPIRPHATRICIKCKQEFILDNGKSIICPSCRVVECANCGKKFIAEMEKRKRLFKHRFCSRICFQTFKNAETSCNSL